MKDYRNINVVYFYSRLNQKNRNRHLDIIRSVKQKIKSTDIKFWVIDIGKNDLENNFLGFGPKLIIFHKNLKRTYLKGKLGEDQLEKFLNDNLNISYFTKEELLKITNGEF